MFVCYLASFCQGDDWGSTLPLITRFECRAARSFILLHRQLCKFRGSPTVAPGLMCIARLRGLPFAWCWCCGHKCKCLLGLYRLGLASTGLQAYGDSCAIHCSLSSPCALIAGWGISLFSIYSNLPPSFVAGVCYALNTALIGYVWSDGALAGNRAGRS